MDLGHTLVLLLNWQESSKLRKVRSPRQILGRKRTRRGRKRTRPNFRAPRRNFEIFPIKHRLIILKFILHSAYTKVFQLHTTSGSQLASFHKKWKTFPHRYCNCQAYGNCIPHRAFFCQNFVCNFQMQNVTGFEW